jgi:hypothetical protein
LAVEDTHEDEGYDPGVLLVGVDESEAEDGHDVADYGDDHAADGDGHAVVGHGREHLADDDDVDDGEAAADDDVQEGAELGAPEAEGVAGGGDGAETELRISVISWKVEKEERPPRQWPPEGQRSVIQFLHSSFFMGASPQTPELAALEVELKRR